MAAKDRQLVLALEGTAALGPFWPLLRTEYIDKIVRAFHGNDFSGQKVAGGAAEMALVVFSTHGPHGACLVQRSGWTTNLDVFMKWLSSISFCAGGLGYAAIADGLAEALLMLSFSQPGNQSSQTKVKHCVLVTTSKPYPLPTPVPRPPGYSLTQQNGNLDAQTQQWFADAETVAKAYSQGSVSLSIISPKELPSLKKIYNAAKLNPTSTDSVNDSVKHPQQHMVLISEGFVDAFSALSGPGTVSVNANPSMIKSEVSAPTHPTSVPLPASGVKPPSNLAVSSLMATHQPAASRPFPLATVKVEAQTSSPMTCAPSITHMSSSSLLHSSSQMLPGQFSSSAGIASQEAKPNIENTDMQDVKPFPQQLRPGSTPASNVSSLLNNLSQNRQVMSSAALPGVNNTLGIQSTGNTSAMHVSNMLAGGMGSAPMSSVQAVPVSGQSALATTATTAGLGVVGQGQQNVVQNTFSSGANISATSNIGATQTVSSTNAGITGTQGLVGIPQSHPGMGLATAAQMGQSGTGINQNVLTGIGPVGVSSAAGSMVPKPNVPQPVQISLQGLPAGNGTTSNIQLPSSVTSAQQLANLSKYLKFWEGILGGSRQGKPVPICRLEGYRNRTSSDKIGTDWPNSMQIIRLISQDHINSKQYQGKADLLVFRAMDPHVFLMQLAEKKLSAVVQLPSQTLLLSTSDKRGRLIGMLFPGDTVIFKPPIPGQPHLQQHLQQLQQQHLQQQQQQQQQQHLQQQQHQQHQQQQQQQHLQQQLQQQQQQPQGMPSAIGQAFAQSQMQNQLSQNQMQNQLSQSQMQSQLSQSQMQNQLSQNQMQNQLSQSQMQSQLSQSQMQSQLTNQARPQLVPQGQFQGQGPTMHGTGYLS